MSKRMQILTREGQQSIASWIHNNISIRNRNYGDHHYCKRNLGNSVCSCSNILAIMLSIIA